MADEAGAAPPAGTDVKQQQTPPAGGVSDSGTDRGAAPPAGGEQGADPGEAGFWPEGWKDRLYSRNDKVKPWLSRYGSPEAAILAGFEANNKIRSGQYRMELTDKASPEEIAQYRQERGIPETADKYELTLPADLKLSDQHKEALKPVLDHFRPIFHGKNVPPKLANELIGEYLKHEENVMAGMRQLAQETTINRRAELKAEFGKEYDQKVNLVHAFLEAHAGEDGRKAIGDLVLHDGTKLGDHPAFFRFVSAAAMANADDDVMARAEVDHGGKSLSDQLDAAIEKGAPDSELLRLSGLIAAQQARESRSKQAA